MLLHILINELVQGALDVTQDKHSKGLLQVTGPSRQAKYTIAAMHSNTWCIHVRVFMCVYEGSSDAILLQRGLDLPSRPPVALLLGLT